MNDEQAKSEKRPYEAPELNRLGSIGSLTAGGSDNMKENTGADDMGPLS
jgi:hypothetical protein